MDAVDPIAVARALHARFGVRRAMPVPVDLIAAEHRAYTLWRDAGRADARVVRAGGVAYLGVAREARGTPRARFSIAHELGHFLLHPDADAIERIHGRSREGREHRYEREADKFAVELLLPASVVAPLSAAAPTLANVLALARRFEVSLTVAGRRWAELSPHPCAFVEIRGDRVRRAKRSASFCGVAVERRLADASWGSAETGVAIVEASVAIPGTETRLVWLAHAAP